MKRNFFKVGDEAWYVPGYADDYLIAIKVKIKEIDSFNDHWIDEPTGHGLAWWELLTKEEAEIELRERTIEHLASCCMDSLITYENAKACKPTLERFRTDSKNFIRSTWVDNGYPDLGFDSYPEKSDWFSITVSDEDVLKRFEELKKELKQ
jgi:hypothetical protein